MLFPHLMRPVLGRLLLGLLICIAVPARLPAEIVSLACEAAPEEHVLFYLRLVWTANEGLAPGIPTLGFDPASRQLEADFAGRLPKEAAGCEDGGFFELLAVKRKKVVLRLYPRVEYIRAESSLVFYFPSSIESIVHDAHGRREHGRVLQLIREAKELGFRFPSMEDLEESAHVEQMRDEGFRLLERGQFEHAAPLLERVLERRGGRDFAVDFALARAQYQTNNYGDAQARLARLYEENPRNKEVLVYLGLIRLAHDDAAGAARYLETAASANVSDSHFFLGFAYFKLKRYDEAKRAFETFLSYGTNPDLVPRARSYVERLAEASPPPPAPASPPPPPPPPSPPPPPPAPLEDLSFSGSVYELRASLDGFGRPSKPLAALRDKVTVLHMWATWCVPCLSEIPSLAKFFETRYAELEEHGLELVTLSMDYTEDALRSFVDKELRRADSLPVYWDPNWEISERLGIRSNHLPKTVLIDRRGQIRDIHVGRHDWQSAELMSRLRALLEEAPE